MLYRKRLLGLIFCDAWRNFSALRRSRQAPALHCSQFKQKEVTVRRQYLALATASSTGGFASTLRDHARRDILFLTATVPGLTWTLLAHASKL